MTRIVKQITYIYNNRLQDVLQVIDDGRIGSALAIGKGMFLPSPSIFTWHETAVTFLVKLTRGVLLPVRGAW
jgi:hypothetical protein